jgi:hypothetical protein
MKKFVYPMLLAGAVSGSFFVMSSVGCSSPDPVGQGSTGGVAGTITVKLDAAPGSGSNGGSGGSGTSGSAPTGDANCGSQTSNTTREPPDVLVVLDRSTSMNLSISDECYCSSTAGSPLCADTANCSTRWQAVKTAVVDTVSNANDVHWGLKYFSTPNAAQCSVSPQMEVPIAADSAAAVKSQIEAGTLSQSTPTAAALKAATAYLETLTDGRPRFILLATDGEPNCANGSTSGSDVNGAATAAKAAYDAGFPVYVVGIGPSLSNLKQLAQSGGTTDYYPVTSSQQLVDAFASISKLVASCTFSLTSVPPDLKNVAVYLDKNLVQQDASNGWSFGGGNLSILLNGDTCDKVTSGKATSVQVLFGCPGVDPPLFIP